MSKYEFDLAVSYEEAKLLVEEAVIKCGGSIVHSIEQGPGGGWPCFFVKVQNASAFEEILALWGFEDIEALRDYPDCVDNLGVK
jgi:hypothetical protein